MRKFQNQKSWLRSQSIWWLIAAALWAVALLLLAARFRKPPEPVENPVGSTVPVVTAPGDEATEITTAPTELRSMELGDGIVIEELLPYSGIFREDRTDEEVRDVLAIRVSNRGATYIQTMNIILSDGAEEAVFSLSTLFPGDTVIVPELGRMNYGDAPAFTAARSENVAVFPEAPDLCADKLEIQCLSGVMNITNISGEDIPEDIFIYYKNYEDGIYTAGITYRVRLSGGLKAGEIRQGSAAHFDPDTSRVVFVNCG